MARAHGAAPAKLHRPGFTLLGSLNLVDALRSAPATRPGSFSCSSLLRDRGSRRAALRLRPREAPELRFGTPLLVPELEGGVLPSLGGSRA
eukprot:8071291-Alexandrium_andersonii.AAC.1